MEVDYSKIYKQAASYAKRHGRAEDAEDFAQEVCLYAFKKRDPDIYLARRFSDYIRRNYGRKGTLGGDARLRATLSAESFIDQAHGSESRDGLDFDGTGRYLVGLSRYERLIYVLHHKFEIKLCQIADSQGVTESRICQVLSGIQKTIDKAVARTLARVPRKGAAELEEILRAQRERMERGEGEEMERFESFAVESFDATGL